MDKFRNDEIEYENGWQNVSYPVVIEHNDSPNDSENNSYQSDSQADMDKKDPEKKDDKHPIQLITLQLIVCLFIALVVFLLKSMGSDAFEKFGDWYTDCMEQTLISDKTFEDIDLSRLMRSSADEVKSTADEATPLSH